MSDGYAVRAIRHMKEEIEMRAGAQVRKDQPESTQEKFQKWHCTFLKCIESWEKICRKKFGATARDSVSLSRVIDRLCSLPGLQSVESCVASRTPLQGTSDANPGISECRALWQQYEQVLSGGPAPSVSLGAVETAPESSVDLLAVEAALESRASSVADGLGSRLGDEEQQLLSQSRSEVDSITFCSQASEVLEIMEQFKGKPVLCVVEAPSSKQVVTTRLMDVAHSISDVVKHNEGFRLVVLAQEREDLLPRMKEKIKNRNQWFCKLLSMSSGETQSRQNSAVFLGLCLPSANDASQNVPFHIKYAKSRAFELLGFKCSNMKCQFRPKDMIKRLEEGLLDSEASEIHADHLEFMDALLQGTEEEEAEGDEQQDTEAANALVDADLGVADDPCVDDSQGDKRKYVTRTFPYTNSGAYYEAVFGNKDVGDAMTAAAVVILTTTAHPSSWFSAKKLCSRVVVMFEGVGDHSVAHGKDIAVRLCLQRRISKLSKAKRVLLTHDDSRLIKGPTLDMNAQSLSAYDILKGVSGAMA